MSAAAAKLLQSCPTLCDPIDGSPPGSPVPGILQARTLELSCQCVKVKSESEVAQSCPTLSDHMDCSLPGSSIYGIFQARVLDWGAIAFSEVYVSDWENHLRNKTQAFIREIAKSSLNRILNKFHKQQFSLIIFRFNGEKERK